MPIFLMLRRIELLKRYKSVLKWGVLLLFILSGIACFDRYPIMLNDARMPGIDFNDSEYSTLGVLYIWMWYEGDGEDQTIYYTLDGTDPTLDNYNVYSYEESPIEVYPSAGDTVIIKAVAAWPDYDLIGPMAERWFVAW